MIDTPRRIKRLPVDKRGYPIPWFVGTVDGEPDFRVIAPGKVVEAVKKQKCWICGEPLGSYLAFVTGPMGAINRIAAEPPAHRECAEYAVQVCPFLSMPNMRRRDSRMPAEAIEPPGGFVKHNPGVSLLWVTRNYRLIGCQTGALFQMDDPTHMAWYTEGRLATRAEAEDGLKRSHAVLREQAAAEGQSESEAVAFMFQEAQRFLPMEHS